MLTRAMASAVIPATVSRMALTPTMTGRGSSIAASSLLWSYLGGKEVHDDGSEQNDNDANDGIYDGVLGLGYGVFITLGRYVAHAADDEEGDGGNGNEHEQGVENVDGGVDEAGIIWIFYALKPAGESLNVKAYVPRGGVVKCQN